MRYVPNVRAGRAEKNIWNKVLEAFIKKVVQQNGAAGILGTSQAFKACLGRPMRAAQGGAFLVIPPAIKWLDK